MRRLLFALPFALLPLAAAHADHTDEHEHEQHDEHASLAAHEHGAAQLNLILRQRTNDAPRWVKQAAE